MIVPVSEATARSVWLPSLLSLVVWREARGASVAAKVAVAHSVLNRVDRPSWWGRTLSQVIGKKWQYSSITAPNDPQLGKFPEPEDPSFLESLAVARAALAGTELNPFPGADSYYDSSIAAPKWVGIARFCGEIKSPHGNALRFYDVDHDYEAPITGHV